MGKEETRRFCINATGSASSISSVVRGKHINLTPDIVAQILGVANTGWCHYLKQSWPPLDGLPSALEIVRKFSNDPTVEDYSRVDKGAMLPLHRLHVLGYGFWLGEIFEYLKIYVKVWEVQTTNDVLGTANHDVVPTPRRSANAYLQRLRAQLTLKDEEIAALRVSHNATMDQLHVSYGLEHDRLVEEIAELKEDLAKYEAALEVEKSTNSENLKGLLDLFKYTPQSSSPLTTSSKIP
ncbi:hypothetical protein KY290_027776 [Solanum tuberosum]|uniref:Uncharacterized protein n=1 Tax=Solanum tuberosum TaxID=4113 RepID=A0ABQ7UG23_SOLTU|nr:hypothetical protein KY284_026791 [Solanum tuberosum]KAH0748544.1 hypothetical protein KY290_027776 [Solanum tuberosum]